MQTAWCVQHISWWGLCAESTPCSTFDRSQAALLQGQHPIHRALLSKAVRRAVGSTAAARIQATRRESMARWRSGVRAHREAANARGAPMAAVRDEGVPGPSADSDEGAAAATPLPAGPLDARFVDTAAGSAAAVAAPEASPSSGATVPAPSRLSYVSTAGWQLFVDGDDGDEFYCNTRTLASQRNVPDDYKYVSPAGWTDRVDEEGDKFFYNVRTEEVMWERPRDHV